MTRRAIVVLALVAAAVAGCSVSNEVPDGEQGATEATDPSAPFPVAIDHRHGTTTITESPDRIVTVGLTDQDALLAVGVVPLATTEWFGEQPSAVWPWATDEMEALGDARPEVMPGGSEVAFETIADLEPDLILAVYSGLTAGEYKTLSEIAPTVAQPEGYVDYGVPWDEQTVIIGRAVGRADEAAAVVADVEAQLEDTRQAHPELDGASGVVATASADGGTISLFSDQDARGRFFVSLGITPPPEVAELAGDSFSADVSRERVDLVDVDVLLWIVNTVEEDVPKFEADPIYSGLEVHTGGHDVFVANLSTLGGATSFVSALSLPYLYDELVPLLSEARDGRG